MSAYVIRGGEAGKRRLELLSRVLWPTTFEFLRGIGLRSGMTCLDLGCGGGDVSIGLARLVGSGGRVVGVDMDPVKLDGARAAVAAQGLHHVEFRQANVFEWMEETAYDLIYCRCLLTHLTDPGAVVARMRRALKPGGILAVEDIEAGGSFCWPPSTAFDRYVALYREVVRRRGADPDIGPKLHRLLLEAGLQFVRVHLVQPVHLDQEGKDISLSTLENISGAVLAEGLATESELAETLAALDAFTRDPTTLIGFPRIFQAWGYRP